MSDLTREEAIKILKDTLYDEKTPTDYLEAVRMGREALENQKAGHWVEIDDYPHKDFECDCCGGKVYGTEEPYEEYKYCPNCGAKMEGENNE